MLNAKRILAAMLAAATVFTAVPASGTVTAKAAATEGKKPAKSKVKVQTKTGLAAINPGENDESAGHRYAGAEGDPSKYAKYASDYFYLQLNSEEKRFYDDLSKAAAGAMDSNENIEYISAKCGSLTRQQATDLAYIWGETEAQYFFVSFDKDYLNNYNEIALYLYKDYQDGNARQQAKKKFFDSVDSYVQMASFKSTDAEKERTIHDQLVKDLNFDPDADITEEQRKNDPALAAKAAAATSRDQSADTALINHVTVCAGYSAGFSVIMNALGIPTISVFSSRHEWNEIQMDDTWYNVDVLWDDPSWIQKDGTSRNDYTDGRNLVYKHFNVSDTTLRSGNESHEPDYIFTDYNRPVCNYDRSSRFDNGMVNLSLSEAIDKDTQTAKENPGEVVKSTVDTDDSVLDISTMSDSNGNAATTYYNGTYWAVITVDSYADDDGFVTVKLNRAVLSVIEKIVGDPDYCIDVRVKDGGEDAFNIYIYDLNSKGQVFNVGDDSETEEMYSIGNWDFFSEEKTFSTGFSKYYVYNDDLADFTSQEIVDSVDTSKKSVTLKKKKSKKVSLSTNGSVRSVKWSSSNKKVASVSSSGKIKAKNKGKATVRAKVLFWDGETKNISIKVKVK